MILLMCSFWTGHCSWQAKQVVQALEAEGYFVLIVKPGARVDIVYPPSSVSAS